MKTHFSFFFLLALLSINRQIFCQTNAALYKPVIDGAEWQICPGPSGVDMSPYTSHGGICDFTIYQAADSTYQLIAGADQVVPPTPGDDGSKSIIWLRFETNKLTNTLWTPKGIFATFDDFGFWYYGNSIGVPSNCVKIKNKFYIIHNTGGGLHCISSTDGKTFQKQTNAAGELEWSGSGGNGRDNNIFDNHLVDGKYYRYYASTGSYTGARSSTAFDSIYTPEAKQLPGPLFESPFVMRYGSYYYMFHHEDVWASLDPLNFDGGIHLGSIAGFNRYASEIIEDNGQYYIAGYGGGIFMRKIKWELVTGSADTIAPSIPTNIASTNKTSTGFTLTWNASTDDVMVSNYEVYKNGALVGTTSSTSYNISGLTAATLYAMTLKAVDGTGNKSALSMALNVTTDNSTFIDDYENSNEPEIYPNPVKDYVNIKLPLLVSARITISDLTGKIILTEISENEISINTSALSSGMYIINISTNNKNYRKLISKK